MQAAFVFSFVSQLPTADREEFLFVRLRSSAKDCSISDLIWPLVSCLHSGIRIALFGDREIQAYGQTYEKWLCGLSLFGFIESVGNKSVVSSEVLSGDDYYFTFQCPFLYSGVEFVLFLLVAMMISISICVPG